MAEPLETIIICESDPNNYPHFGEDGKRSRFEVILECQYPDNIPEIVKFSAYAELHIIHGVAYSLELSRTKNVKMDFRLDKEPYINLKPQIESMIANHNNHQEL